MILPLLTALSLANLAPACPPPVDSAGYLCHAIAASDAEQFAAAADNFEKATAVSPPPKDKK